MRWQPTAVGALALAALEVAVSSQAAASRVGGIFNGFSSVAEKIISPTVPALGAAPATNSNSAPSATVAEQTRSSDPNFMGPLPAGPTPPGTSTGVSPYTNKLGNPSDISNSPTAN